MDFRGVASEDWRALLFLGLPCLGLGSWMVLVAAGALELPAGRTQAPPWVFAAGGVPFVVAGLSLLGRLVALRRWGRWRGMWAATPWAHDYPWDPSGIRDASDWRWRKAAGGALVMAAFLAPFSWWAWMVPGTPLPVRIANGILALVVLGCVWHALRLLRSHLRWGGSRLVFDRFPFHPGEALAVRFLPNRFERVRFTLRFVEEGWETVGTGRRQHARRVAYGLHEEVQEVVAGPAETEVAVKFPLPSRADWVTALSGRPTCYWELMVEAEDPGTSFRAFFPLPVYPRR